MQHVLPELLRPELSVIFCGTAAGTVSAKAGAYYANPRNKFWSILHESGLTPVKLNPQEFGRLLDYNIGLTDLVKDAHGNDGVVRRATADDREALRMKIERFKPSFLAFTSKNAGKQFLGSSISLGPQPPIRETKVFVLPSTSPAARWQWDETYKHWHMFAEEVAGARLKP
ncbi:mismatch-specific DNA-glycosylase [Bradyrhizobium sp. dw_78]|uniref:mismatch-specific DNA-glycosylase n=1 Tax=Bradyrhizobium sp. dw_78 TaxID=2719793 RepID=UPI001BD5A360|nr:mismatch-specific DNA-glycosylase [Bradyrhizobium sp. dw_78]